MQNSIGRLKLHPSQLEIYYDQIMDRQNSQYNIGGYVDLFGLLEVKKLEQAIESLHDLSDIHKISFDFSDKEPSYYLSDHAHKVPLVKVDCSNDETPDTKATTWMQDRFNTAFDIDHGPLFEFALLRINPKKHKLLIKYHHLLIDGFGFVVLLKYIANKYSDLLNGTSRVSTYGPYKEETIKDNLYLDSTQYQDDLSYWSKKFSYKHAPVIAEKYRRDQHQKKKVETLFFDIDQKRRQYLADVSKLLDSSIHRLTIMALYIYYGFLVEDGDLVFGAHAHKRKRHQLKVIGNFAGIIPFRMKYNRQLTIHELADQIRGQFLKDYRHQYFPISHLNKELNLWQRDEKQLFEVAVNYLLLDFNVDFAQLKSKVYDIRSQEANIPLMLWWRDFGPHQPLQLRIDYNPAYLQTSDVHLLTERLFNIIDQFATNLETPIHKIEISTKQERDLINTFNPKQLKFSSKKHVIQLFEDQVLKNPDRVALSWEGMEMTYQEVNEKASKLALILKTTYHSEAKSFVGIMMDNSAWYVVAILGVLKAGYAYVPIDINYPEDRKRFIIKDTNINLIISDSTSMFQMENFGIQLLIADLQIDTFTPTEVLAQDIVQLSDLAYIIYTSGSLGEPKGVPISHSNLSASCQARLNYYDEMKSMFLVPSFSFDSSVAVLWGMLLTGGCLILAERRNVKDIKLVIQILKNKKVESILCIPSYYQFLLSEFRAKQLSLKHIILAGEALNQSLVIKHFENLPDVSLYNEYGPTECTVWSTATELTNIDEPISIGKPIETVKAYILTKYNQVAPLGEIGELCIAGPQVAKGYLNRPLLTKEKFIDNPFDVDGRGPILYKTGDFARWLPDGKIEFRGRKDEQVKIRGFRVELGEIEKALNDYDQVSLCAVIAEEDVKGHKVLIAYVTTEKTSEAEREREKTVLKAYLSNRLPDFMIPSSWYFLEVMPLNSNGKIDKKALPKPATFIDEKSKYVAPRNHTEQMLATIWAELFDIEKVGIYDDFFEIGGQSLHAVSIISTIREKFKININITDVFEYPDIEQLSLHIETINIRSTLPTISAKMRPEKLPLSYGQEQLWFLHQAGDSSLYHQPLVLQFQGALRKDFLEKAINKIVERHEVLRTVFRSEDGVPFQQLLLTPEWTLKYSERTDSIGDESMKIFINNEIKVSFDLANDYLLRAHLVKDADGEHILIITIHHIISDGWSLHNFNHELLELYQAQIQGRAAGLADLSIQYPDYVLWERELSESPIIQSQLDYWKNKLANVSPIGLTPSHQILSKTQIAKGNTVSFVLNQTVSEQLRELSNKENATLFMSLVSILKLLLYRDSGEEDICIGSPVAGRTQAEMEPLIGLLLNTIALRTNLSEDLNFIELLARVKSTTLEAYKHQDVPFSRILKLINSSRRPSEHRSFFKVFFNMLNQPQASGSLNGLQIKYLQFEEIDAKFELSIYVMEEEQTIKGLIVYDSLLFAQERIQNLAIHFEELAEAIVKNPSGKISSLNFFSSSELKDQSLQLEDFFND